MCSSAPDTSGMNAAAVAQTQLSKDQLDWFRKIYDESAPDRAQAKVNAQKVTDANLSMMSTQTGIAKDYADYNKSTFRPLEKGIVASAENYDTQERRDAEAGRAVADVSQAFSAARGQSSRNLSRMGVDPNSGRALALSNTLDIDQASNMAGAAAKARNMVETTGFARKMDAAGLGRGLAGNASTAAGLALNAGNAGLGASMTPLQVTSSGAGLMQTGFSGAMQGNSSAGSMYGNIAGIQNQANASNNAIWGGLGSIAGAYLGKKP